MAKTFIYRNGYSFIGLVVLFLTMVYNSKIQIYRYHVPCQQQFDLKIAAE